jgi:hypothetical protein
MLEANKVNNAQIELIKRIAEGEVDFPKTHFELSELVKHALLLKDHEQEERESIDKCKTQFLRTMKQKSVDDEWVYLSVVKNVLERRNYFTQLRRSQAVRGLDAMRSVTRELIKDGVIKIVGSQAMLTRGSDDYLANLENKI